VGEVGELSRSAFVGGSKAAATLESIEASFDLITMFVDGKVVQVRDLAATVRRDHGFGTYSGDQRARGIAAIGFVGEDSFSLIAIVQG